MFPLGIPVEKMLLKMMSKIPDPNQGIQIFQVHPDMFQVGMGFGWKHRTGRRSDLNQKLCKMVALLLAGNNQ